MKLSSVLRIIDLLEKNLEHDDKWKQLSPEHISKFESCVYVSFCEDEDDTFRLDHFDKKRLWNISDATARASMIADPALIHWILQAAIEKLKNCCLRITQEFERHVSDATTTGEDPRALDLLRFYGTFNAINTARPPCQSAGAVSDGNDCRSSAVGGALKADQIHHNMFKDESELYFQNFKRFEIGGQRDPDPSLETLINALGLESLKERLMPFLPEALANLKHARSFLSGCSSPLEPLTQLVFVTFLTDLLEKINGAFPSYNGNVVIVAGMDTIDVPVNICAEYMRLNAAKRGTTHAGGPRKTTLKMKSDVAIIEGRSDQYAEESVSVQQQKMFLNCLVNVEMKRWRLLANSKNKSPLTQVAAESMVRYMKLENESKRCLFSMLTDCMVLSCVCHKVSDQEYWISRSVDSPEEILLCICWVYLCSIGEVESDVSNWEYREDSEEVAEEKAGGETGQSRLESISGNDEIDDDDHNDAHLTGNTTSERASQDYVMSDLPAVSFEDFEKEEEEEEERTMWQTMFLMDNHRKYGTPLPLTEAVLSLHNTRGGP